MSDEYKEKYDNLTHTIKMVGFFAPAAVLAFIAVILLVDSGIPETNSTNSAKRPNRAEVKVERQHLHTEQKENLGDLLEDYAAADDSGRKVMLTMLNHMRLHHNEDLQSMINFPW